MVHVQYFEQYVNIISILDTLIINFLQMKFIFFKLYINELDDKTVVFVQS
jgi:hypothetical protein